MIEQSKLEVPGEFDVVGWEMPEIAGDRRAHDFGDPDDERLATLRDEFDLEAVVADAADDLQAILALKRWVRSRWDHGWSMSYRTVTDALDILREAQRGEQFNCGHYSRVFAACATALGIPARQVSLGLAGCSFPRGHDVGNVGHSVAEAWCNELRGWVAMDCDLNVHYERDGLPLSALEVHDAWLSEQAAQVTRVHDEPAFVVPSGPTVEVLTELMPDCRGFDDEMVALKFERFGRHDAMDYYARLRVGGMEWLDERCPPTFVRHFAPGPAVRYTNHAPDLYPTLNAVRIGAAPRWDEAGAALTITLEHCAPWFEHYEASIDGRAYARGPWEQREASFDWPMREGLNRLEARTVNRRGRPGIVSALQIAYARAIW